MEEITIFSFFRTTMRLNIINGKLNLSKLETATTYGKYKINSEIEKYNLPIEKLQAFLKYMEYNLGSLEGIRIHKLKQIFCILYHGSIIPQIEKFLENSKNTKQKQIEEITSNIIKKLLLKTNTIKTESNYNIDKITYLLIKWLNNNIRRS